MMLVNLCFSGSAGNRICVDLPFVGKCGLRKKCAEALSCFFSKRTSADRERASFEVRDASFHLYPWEKRQENVGLLGERRGCG